MKNRVHNAGMLCTFAAALFSSAGNAVSSPPPKLGNIVIVVDADSYTTITVDGKRISCQELKAIFAGAKAGKPLDCSTFRERPRKRGR